MTFQPKELISGPRTAPFSRIQYLRYLPEEQIVQFFRGLFQRVTESHDDGQWDRVDDYLNQWESQAMGIFHTSPQSLRYDEGPWAPPAKPLKECKLALITTGGVYLDGDRPFEPQGDWSFRVLPKDAPRDRFRVRHGGYDTSGAEADINCVFPYERFKEIEAEGLIGQLAATNYGFMGLLPAPQELLEESAPEVARRLKQDGVDAVVIGTT